MNDDNKPAPPDPQAGGCYVRDPQTLQITQTHKTEEAPMRDLSQHNPPEAAPAQGTGSNTPAPVAADGADTAAKE